MSLSHIEPERDPDTEKDRAGRDQQPAPDIQVAELAAPAASRGRSRSKRRFAAVLLRSLTAVIIGSLILRVAAQMMGLMLQSYFDRIGLLYAAAGIITASFFLAELVGAPILGAMSDRYGRKRFIILGPVLGAVAVQITSMTTVIWILVITRLLEGLSTASAIPATLSYISEATSARPKLRARIVGLFEITFIGGMALGAALGGVVWENFGGEATILGLHFTSPAFSINGLIYLISLAVFAWGLKGVRRASLPREPDPRGKWGHYRAILKSPRVWRLVPAWIALNSVIGIWFNYSIRLLTGKNNHQGEAGLVGPIEPPVAPAYEGQLLMGLWSDSPRDVYVGFGILLVIFAAGVMIWSFYLGRYRKITAMIAATFGLAAILPSIYGLNHLDSLSSPLLYPLVASLLLGVVILSGFAPAALTYLADVTELHAEDRGTIMGLYSVFLGVGQFIGTASGGFFAQWKGIDGLVPLSVIFGIVTLISLFSLRKQGLIPAAADLTEQNRSN
jgi:MFS family permease